MKNITALFFTGWPAIFFIKRKYNSRTIQEFFKHVFGPQYFSTLQNTMIDSKFKTYSFTLSMFKDCIYFMHVSYHFSQTISQKWNLIRPPKNCFHKRKYKTLLKVDPPKQSSSKVRCQQNTLI